MHADLIEATSPRTLLRVATTLHMVYVGAVTSFLVDVYCTVQIRQTVNKSCDRFSAV